MKWNAYLISAAIASMTLVACSEDDPGIRTTITRIPKNRIPKILQMKR